MLTREQIVEQALSLPPADRLFVIDALDQSFEQGVGFATPEIAAEWSAEIDRRIDAYRRGEMQAEDAEVSLQQMREALAEHRARKART